MFEKLRERLSFPYEKKYEEGFNRSLVKTMYKPLLITVFAVFFMIIWLLVIFVFWPQTLAPAQYAGGLLVIHFVFFLVTLLALFLSVILRRAMYRQPKIFIGLCNGYAIAISLWSSTLSAYASSAQTIYTAFVFVTLCVAMVSLFKPWLAIVAIGGNYVVYWILLYVFSLPGKLNPENLYSAALTAFVGIVITITFYRFRTRNYYDQQIIIQQMEEINRFNRRLQQMVHIDPLTGLFNRRFYDEILPKEIESRDKTLLLAAIMFDVDYFKRFNDEYGHPAGDLCLMQVADILKRRMPEERAYAVRYGGEEFFILMAVANEKEVEEFAEDIRESIEKEYIVHGLSPFGKVTVSGGIFVTDSKDISLVEITEGADQALYRAKSDGRNRIVKVVALR